MVVDTTVQEKAVAFPPDARFAYKARVCLVRLAKRTSRMGPLGKEGHSVWLLNLNRKNL